MVRAFKSTMEDLEEKKSIHSVNSFHSLRQSRSHHGPQAIMEVVTEGTTTNFYYPSSQHCHFPPAVASSRVTSHCQSVLKDFHVKSQSFENASLASRPSPAVITDAITTHKMSRAKTLSHSDITRQHLESGL